ncbi:MAG: YqaJ viral recombinase family protein [Pseudonocardiales bacterium]|nr:YqaJ viral recombinase family protein [Pseudonocardiales bacterium]
MRGRTLGSAVKLGWYDAGSPEWYAARQGALGASEIAAVLGLSPWQSRFSLWHLKQGNIPPEPPRPELEWGKDQEALIARRFAREHAEDGWKVQRIALYRNLVRKYQVAQPDRALFLGGGLMAALECKTDRYADDWGTPGTDEMPVYYRCQGLWQMDCFGWSRCYFAVLITGVDYCEYVLEYDRDEALELREAAEEFMASIEAGTPPNLDDHAATYRAVRQLHPLIDNASVEIPPELARQYRAALDAVDAAEAAKHAAAARILDAMGRARRATCDKQNVAIRVPSKGDAPPHLRPSGTNSRRKKAAAA